MRLRHSALTLALLASTAAYAQMGGPPAAPAPGTVVAPAVSMDAAVTQLQSLWTGAASAMPADKYSFAPSADMFKTPSSVQFTGVRTFAQLVTHTVQANFMYWSFASGLKPDFDVASIPKMTNKEDIVKAAKASMEFGHKAAATITPANAFEAVRGRPGATRITAIAGGVIHLRDEYGQMVEYLRLNGLVPPASEGKPLANPAK